MPALTPYWSELPTDSCPNKSENRARHNTNAKMHLNLKSFFTFILMTGKNYYFYFQISTCSPSNRSINQGNKTIDLFQWIMLKKNLGKNYWIVLGQNELLGAKLSWMTENLSGLDLKIWVLNSTGQPSKFLLNHPFYGDLSHRSKSMCYIPLLYLTE